MKKILVLLFVFLFAFTVYAQEEAPLFEWNGTGIVSDFIIVYNQKIIHNMMKSYKMVLTL